MSLTKAFFASMMGFSEDDVYIPTAHRLGKFTPGKQRAMIACIPDAGTRSKIFKNANRLSKTNHYICSQIPPSMDERKQFVLPEYKAKKADVNNKATLRQGKLLIKGIYRTSFCSLHSQMFPNQQTLIPVMYLPAERNMREVARLMAMLLK